jgi:hypothetical protein
MGENSPNLVTLIHATRANSPILSEELVITYPHLILSSLHLSLD